MGGWAWQWWDTLSLPCHKVLAATAAILAFDCGSDPVPCMHVMWCSPPALQAAGLSNADLCYVRYEGDAPNVLPYFIGLDDGAQEVVLAIRGGEAGSRRAGRPGWLTCSCWPQQSVG